MSAAYRLTKQAEVDVQDIWLYIAADNVNAADRLVDRFTETFEQLATTPRIGQAQEQYRSGLRCFPVGRYVIFYSIVDDEIEVYRVLHGARRLEDLL